MPSFTTMDRLLSNRALSIALGLLLPLAALAQQPAGNPQSSGPVLHKPAAESEPKPATPSAPKPVSLVVTVIDKKGQPVTTITQQDLVLEQDGQSQLTWQLTQQPDTPLIFGVLADTDPGQRRALADERKSATDFTKRALREGKDKAFVLHFDKEVELLQDVTASKDKLAKGIDQISVSEGPHPAATGRRRDEEDREHPRFFFGGTLLYDAIYLSADELLKSQPGRKAVIVFSDGQDRESKTSLEHAIEAAQRSNMLVYCVYVDSERDQQPERDRGTRRAGGSPFPGGGGPFPGGGGPFPGGGGQRRMPPPDVPKEDKGAGKKVLQRIAKETGARYFELSKKMPADQIYSQIEDELKHQYVLSFTPEKSENGLHKVHLTTRNRDWTVLAPEAYYVE